MREEIQTMGFNWRWFNWSPPFLRIGRTLIKPWNVFNRCSTEGHWWGVGLLQVGNRHLVYVGYSGICALFVGKTP